MAVKGNHYLKCHLYDEEVMSNQKKYDDEYAELSAKWAAEDEKTELKNANNLWNKFKK